MYRFRYFLVEAKVDDFANRYVKYHSAHPEVVANPERAKELVKHAHQFAQGHDESIFLTKHLLDGVYKPGEDDATIKSTLGKWRRAKTEGLVGGKLSDHTHDTISAIFNDIPQLNLQKRQAQALGGMEKYRVGEIEHPKHGTLTVYQVRNKKISDDKEYENISDSLRKTCSGSSWCVLPQQNGPIHLKHYSHGPGIFFYVDKSGSPVLSHGFGDRGVVRPDNSVIDEKESESIINKTHKILPKDEQEGYNFFHRGKNIKSDLEYQSKMYDEFGSAHSAAHFLDPKVDTHPKLINRIIEDHLIKNKTSNKRVRQEIIDATVKHKNFSSDNIDHILNLYKEHHDPDSYEDGNISSLALASTKNPNFSEKHIDRLFDSKIHTRLLQGALHESPNVKLKHLKRAFSGKDPDLRNTAIRHNRADADMYMEAMMDKDLGVVTSAIHGGVRNKKLKNEHIHKLFDRLENDKDLTNIGRGDIHKSIAHVLTNHNVSKEIVDKTVDYVTSDKGFDADLATQILRSTDINDKHIDALQKYYSGFPEIHSTGTLLHSGKAKSGMLDAFVNNPTHEALRFLSRNTGFNSEQYGKLIDHLTKTSDRDYVQPFIADKSALNLLKNPSLNTENIRQLYKQVGSGRGSIPHELIKSERLPKDIYDTHFSSVLKYAEVNENNKIPPHMFDGMQHISNMTQSPNFESKHLDQILDSPKLQQKADLIDTKHMTALVSSGINNAIKRNKFNSKHLQKVFDIKSYEGNSNYFAMGAAHELANKSHDPNYKHDPKIVEMVKAHPDKSVSDFHVFMDNDFNSEKLHKIMQGESQLAALSGFAHPLATSEHYISALRSPHENIRNLAKSQLEDKKSTVNESIFVAARRILYT